MRRQRILNWLVRVGLFSLILTLGTAAALVVGETQGLAMADLSKTPVQALTTAPESNALYANVNDGAATAGIYRSNDRGRTWELVSPGPSASLNALVVHPTNEQVLFAGTNGGPVATTNNLWRSDDGGRTWRKFFLSLPANPDGVIPAVTSLATDPQEPGILYIGTAGQGVYRFDVGPDGQGYTLIGDVSLYNADVKGLVVGPDSLVYALTNDGLFVNSGEKWNELETVPEMPITLAIAPWNPKTLYAGTPSSGVYRSTDGGQNWESISAGLDLAPGAALRVTALAVDDESPDRLVVATAYGLGSRLAGGGIYESFDGGDQWRKLGEVEDVVKKLTLDGRSVYAATSKGLARYGDAGEVTDPVVMPLPVLQPLANPNGLQVGILILTVIMAGLTLVGRTDWLRLRLSHQIAS